MAAVVTEVPVETNGQLTRRFLKTFRLARGWSARRLARELGGYTRSYIKSLEGGSLPISRKFARAFAELEARAVGPDETADPARGPILFAKFKLPPPDILLLAKARKCRGCRRWVILPYAQQRYCDAVCRQRAKSRGKGVRQ